MIKVNKYEIQTIEHFDSDGNSLGFLNELEHIDLATQIVEQQVSGYYLIFNESKIVFHKDGRIAWIKGIYDTVNRLRDELCKTQIKTFY